MIKSIPKITLKNILCDADFFVALLIQNDSNHLKARAIVDNHLEANFLYSNLTKYELMTVLSRKLDQKKAVECFELFTDTFEDEFQFDITLEPQIIDFYKQSTNKNQSFFDIVCLVTAQKLNYKIASFDQFYPKDLLCQ